MANVRPLTDEMAAIKKLAESRDLELTWDDVTRELPGIVASLSDYSRRRLHREFEAWITRERLKRKGFDV